VLISVNHASLVIIFAKWTLQRKNGRDSVGTLYRVVLGEVAFCYDNVNLQQKGARYGVHTYLQGKRAHFISV